ncbi:MAG: hypothetical protein O7J95_15620 [Planctomycetota bacterium]|nr:hypothetical protein [Planctomycetota bacterium]
MKDFLLTLVSGLAGFLPILAHADVTAVKQPPTDSTNGFYVANRPPLRPTPLIKLPVGSIRPEGWRRASTATSARSAASS